jgi:hypothetical protein
MSSGGSVGGYTSYSGLDRAHQRAAVVLADPPPCRDRPWS